VITSEELRVAALTASAKRGKWVSRRRVLGRWLCWATWHFVLPVIGLFTVIVMLAGFAFWQYMGRDVAYATAQTWVQQEFGSFKSSSTSSQATTVNSRMINSTDETSPDLQIDRNLKIKTTP
jgi:type II secretory pathway component PulL